MGTTWGSSEPGPREDKGMKLSPIAALCVVFLLVGVAAPRLRRLIPDSVSLPTTSHADKGVLNAGLNRARAFTTNSRIRGIREALRFYVRNHGEAPGSLDIITGDGLDRDGWNRRFYYVAPTEKSLGYLRSFGPDGMRSKDDIWVQLRWQQLAE